MVHTWKIYDLKRTIDDGVVSEVIYACESEHEGVGTREIGAFTITGDTSDEGFIEYENLTEEIVLGWVDGNVSKATIEESNATRISDIIAEQAAITEANGKPW